MSSGVLWPKILLLLAAFCIALAAGQNVPKKKLICYYTNWSRFRKGDAFFNEENIPKHCTHLIYAFARITHEFDIKPSDEYADITLKGYSLFNNLKKISSGINATVLSLETTADDSPFWVSLLLDPISQKTFAKNAMKYLREKDFDGLDFDIQFHSHEILVKKHFTNNVVQLFEELNKAFKQESLDTGKPQLSISLIIPSMPNGIYEVDKLNDLVDWFTVNTYKYHTTAEKQVAHLSPLYSRDNLNVNYTISYYLNKGVDSEKLIMSIPLFGLSYTLENASLHAFNSSAIGPGKPGEGTVSSGTLSYYEICERINLNGWKVERPRINESGPYAHLQDQWVGYDDELMVMAKANYAYEMKLGGIMFWSLDNDDFRGKCGKKSFPLIQAAKKELLRKRIVPSTTTQATVMENSTSNSVKMVPVNNISLSNLQRPIVQLNFYINNLKPNADIQVKNNFNKLNGEIEFAINVN